MNIKVNPFQELYQGDSILPNAFVDLFSPVIVEHALPIFQPGNVIVKGLVGSGKSMLLNLLDPEIRIAYEKSNVPFPVPEKFNKFIGAGINLKRSGISQFGQRAISDAHGTVSTPFYFGDFLNHWIVYDIFKTIKCYHSNENPDSVKKSLGLNFDAGKIHELSLAIAKDDCWLNAFEKGSSLDDILHGIKLRIDTYLKFMNYNCELPDSIKNSKTSIGAPIASTVKLLKRFEIVNPEVEFFIRIDQYEELGYLDMNNNTFGSQYQQMINRLLSMRDTSVSYRIGARPYSWQDNPKTIFGTNGILENRRNYDEVDLDKVLRRQENKRTWVFPKFAEDIFHRRLNHSKYVFEVPVKDLLPYVFGASTKPSKKVLMYFAKNKRNAVKLEKEWPEKFKTFLIELTEHDPLSARLGEAWVRQKDPIKVAFINNIVTPYPWETPEKKWWKKERIEQALFQIASRNNQLPLYFGQDDIIGLSGGNILCFISLCKHIWNVWIRDSDNEEDNNLLPQFAPIIQSVGIRETSADWLKDISTVKGGKERLLFVTYLGTMFYKLITSDISMSNPGFNGFSLALDQYNSEPEIASFLKQASDNGDLYEMEHTSKTDSKQGRRKWYLNPILSPYFKITHKHIKEPLYADVSKVKLWLLESKAFADQSKFITKIKVKTETT